MRPCENVQFSQQMKQIYDNSESRNFLRDSEIQTSYNNTAKRKQSNKGNGWCCSYVSRYFINEFMSYLRTLAIVVLWKKEKKNKTRKKTKNHNISFG